MEEGKGGGEGVKLPPLSNFLKTFRKYKVLCFCDFQFISIPHILENFQGCTVLRIPAVAVLLGAPQNFWKYIILHRLQIFAFLLCCCILMERLYFMIK